MDNEQLNQRLIQLGNQATNAHEILRGVTDALAVIGQSTVRAATDDLDSVEDADAWREEANAAADQSEELLHEAARLLRRTAHRLEDAADRLEGARDE
jgi:hypothetical protein